MMSKHLANVEVGMEVNVEVGEDPQISDLRSQISNLKSKI
jgi:hypothetical protein